MLTMTVWAHVYIYQSFYQETAKFQRHQLTDPWDEAVNREGKCPMMFLSSALAQDVLISKNPPNSNTFCIPQQGCAVV